MSWAGLEGETVRDWTIVIQGAPVLCSTCDGKIIGSGAGPVVTLLEAVARHIRTEHSDDEDGTA